MYLGFGKGLDAPDVYMGLPSLQHNLKCPNLISYDPDEAAKIFDKIDLIDEFNEDGIEALMSKSILTSDFEKMDKAPPFFVTKNQEIRNRKKEREESTGKGWHKMKAPKMTEELENDLKLLEMRSALDPSKHYKTKRKMKDMKFFQIGTVIEGKDEFYSGRLTKKQRKQTLVDELMADAEFQKYNKKRYKKIILSRNRLRKGVWRKKKK